MELRPKHGSGSMPELARLVNADSVLVRRGRIEKVGEEPFVT